MNKNVTELKTMLKTLIKTLANSFNFLPKS